MESAHHSRIAEMFAQCRTEKRLAFMAYFPTGFPSFNASVEICCALLECGVDALEIGIPFSDPLLDGPVIQQATQQALAQGTRVAHTFELIRKVRERFPRAPLLIMSSLNPLLAFGIEHAIETLLTVGGDGFIVPDLLFEESVEIREQCESAAVELVQFLAPTSTEDRVKKIAPAARGFIYLVSLTGVTGTQMELADEVREVITQVRRASSIPVVVGFGIHSPSQVRALKAVVDGFIVGSALVQCAKNGTGEVMALARDLREAAGLAAPNGA